MNTTIHLSSAELARYARHIAIPEFNLEGQKKLKAAKVLVIGAGGLGSPLLLYLAAAGVGQIGTVDFDVVDNSGTGSSTSGISYLELDVSTGATTATLPIKALDISQDPENSDVSTANTNVLVTIQNHLFGQKQVGLA